MHDLITHLRATYCIVGALLDDISGTIVKPIVLSAIYVVVTHSRSFFELCLRRSLRGHAAMAQSTWQDGWHVHGLPCGDGNGSQFSCRAFYRLVALALGASVPASAL